MAIRVLVIYFVLKDSFSFVIRGLALKFNSKGIGQLIWITAIYMLMLNFKFTFILLVILSLLINYYMKLREMQINALGKLEAKRE